METRWWRLAWWVTTHVLRAIGRTQGGTAQGWGFQGTGERKTCLYIYIIIACFFWLRFQKPKDFRRIGEGSPTGRMVHGAVGMDERNGMIFSR